MEYSKTTRLEIHISYDCTNNCIFCSERHRLNKFYGYFVNKKFLLDRLNYFKTIGYNHLSLTGGEPTLHPNFTEIIFYAKILSYKTYVGTNGYLLSSAEFFKNNIPYIDELCFSVHGADAYTHNLHTKNVESFKRVNNALVNLEKFKPKTFVMANIVVTVLNFSNLEETINFLGKFKQVKQILISNLAPEGKGSENFKKLAVPLHKIKNKVKKIIEICKKNNKIVRFFGVPLCSLGENLSFSNDLWWSSRTTIERDYFKKDVSFKTTTCLKPDRKRIQPKSICGNCIINNLCGGIFQKYATNFGIKELKQYNYTNLNSKLCTQ